MTNRRAAIKIIKTLRSNGHQALLAGGCVRDMLLARAAKDYDVVTSAHPDQIIKLFKRTVKIGAKFGVIMVLKDAAKTEVATFRTDADYSDGRHPQNVQFTNPKEDASRRDFTINGMFYDPVEKKVIDYVKGQQDLRNKLIRTIGNAKQRFSEDYLRMLRALRFSTQLGFEIEKQTYSAISANAANIKKISGERIQAELEAILTNPNRALGAKLLFESKIADVIFPSLSKQDKTLAVKVLAKLKKRIDFPLALAALFVNCPTDRTIKELTPLRLSNAQKKHLKFLLDNRQKLLNADMDLADFKMLFAESYFWDLYELQRSIQRTKNQTISPLIKIKKRAAALAGVEVKPKPLLTGHQLIKLGAVPGPQLGQLAEELYIQQLGEKINTPSQAKNWVAKWLEKHSKNP